MMDKLLEKDVVIRFMALVIASLLWYQAVQEQNPYVEKVFETVSIRVQNVPTGYTVLGGAEPATIQVKLSGLAKTMTNLTAKDLVAYVDLSGSKSGVQTVPVKFIEPAGTTAIEITPTSAMVSVDAIVRQNYPVSIVQQGLPAAGYSVGKVFFDPATVIVEGARSRISNVKNVAVVVDINGATTNITKPGTVNVFDVDGVVVRDVTVTPPQVNISVEIVQAQSQKNVPITPSLVGEPAEGYQITGVALEPNTVTITGPQDRVNSINAISTQAVELTGRTEDLTQAVSLQLPEGIAVLGPSVYNLTIRIGAVEPPVTP